jgi:biotin operon repressor
MLARESRSLERCGLRRAQLSQEARHRLDDYVRHARAAGASWQQVGSALGITRQSAWERFRHLPGCAEKRAVASRLRHPPAQRSAQMQKLKRVQRMRAAGASWQQVGSALGITRQSAWERFHRLCIDRKAQGIPDGVLQKRHQQPHIFADWVMNAAKDNESIQRWLEEPDIDLGMMAGFDRAVQPKELLGKATLRDFLMASGHSNVAPSSVPGRADCPICGRKFIDENFLASHREHDHGNVANKPKREK